MTRITITGDHQTLLTHAALWGTAMILTEDLGPSRVRAGWLDEDGSAALLNPQAVIEADGVSEIEIGRITQGLALRVSASEHWASQVAWRDAKEHTVSLLTPRTGLPKFKDLSGEAPGWWQQLEDRRASIMAELTPLEQEMARGLGERSWWLSEPSGLRPDLGASPWEMKTRNRGEEFLKNRFLPLAAEVATWDPEKIIAGLTGESRDDAVGGIRPSPGRRRASPLPGRVTTRWRGAPCGGWPCSRRCIGPSRAIPTAGVWYAPAPRPSRVG
ncbi:hypothetical protein A5N15_09275 [Rothia kristinae]|uniref:Uncharacterized protein n=1 Tax=Rothia kristinae TaxID=37923 RepID=A0A657IUD3_9MICC|nr:hypothetical protein A5N15_09275 [Rothia kristinae]